MHCLRFLFPNPKITIIITIFLCHAFQVVKSFGFSFKINRFRYILLWSKLKTHLLSSMDEENIGLLGPQQDPSKVNSSNLNTNVKHDYVQDWPGLLFFFPYENLSVLEM